MEARHFIRTPLLVVAVAGLVGAASSAHAQTYVIAESARPFVALSSGTALSFTNTRTGAALVTIGFPFTYFGNRYTAVNVGLNGVLTFAADCTAAACGQGLCNANRICEESTININPPGSVLPSTTIPNGWVAPFWDDLVLGSTGSVRWALVGTSPRRELVVEWRSMQRFSTSSSNATFQVRLEEGTNVIRMAYGPFTSSTDNALWVGTIGAESPNGLTGLRTRPCAANDSCRAQDLIDLQDRVIEILQPRSAELVGEATAPGAGLPGSALPFNLTVRNLGASTTTVAFEARVYLSTDGTIDRRDQELGVLSFPALPAGQQATRTLSATVPSVPRGLYTLGALVDTSSVVAEAVETNNVVVAPSRFLVGADLSIEVTAPSSGGIGDDLSVPAVLVSNGVAVTSAAVDLYLSLDATYGANDVKIGTTTTAVAATSRTNVTLTGQVPSNLPAGSWRVIARIDPGNRVDEANEANNLAVSTGSTNFIPADLFVPSLVVDRAIAFRGQEVVVTVDITNEGGSSARGFDYEFYLSTNELISRISDPFLGSAGPLTVAVGQTVRRTHTFTITSTIPINEYFVGVIVNANQRVTETNVNDNIRRSRNKIIVRDPGPDFAIAQIATPPGAAAGERLIVERAIFNLGNRAGGTAYDVWLSADDRLDPATDTRIWTGGSTLAIGAEDFGLDLIPLAPTLTEGDYFILYRLDGPDRVDELDETNNLGSTSTPIRIVGSRLTLLGNALPFGTVGVAYGAVLGAAGGAGSYRFSVVSGRLPEGLSLDPMLGRVAGTPTREERARFRIAVTDGLVSDERDFSILVAEQSEPLQVVTRSLTPAYAGRPYRQTLTAFGGVPPYTWEARGLLPDGLVLGEDGVISGRPRAADLRMLSARVVDARGTLADRVLILRVLRPSQAVRLASEALPDGRIGDPYAGMVTVEEATGTMPFTYALLEGQLPDGLIRDQGQISGIPTRAGTYDFTIRVTDAVGEFDVNRYIVVIGERNGVRFITSDLPPAEIGRPYVRNEDDPVRLVATTEIEPGTITFSLVGGALPPGITLAEDGTVSGTPARVGLFDFVVAATDVAGQRELRAFGVLVNDPPVPPPPAPEDEGCVCVRGGASGGPPSGLALLLAASLAIGARRGSHARRSRAGRHPRVGAGVGGLALIGALLAGSPPAAAQNPYRVAVRNGTYVERTGGTALMFSSPANGSAAVTLPFAFRFFGTDHTAVNVSTNGYIVLGAGAATSQFNQASPNRSTPNNLIAAVWDGLQTTGEEWFVEGTAPNRRVIFQWRNATRSGAPTEGQPRAQIHLLEGRSRFEVHYGGAVNATVPAVWSFSAGYEDAGGQFGGQLLPCGVSCNRDNLPSDTIYVVGVDAGQDVSAGAIEAPVGVFPGTSVSLRLSFESEHAMRLGPFEWAVYLVPAADSAPSGMPLFTSTATLEPFEASTQSVMVTIPSGAALGRYRFALVVDTTNVIGEVDELDNLSFSPFVRVGAPRPDFTVASVGFTGTSAAPGGTLPVTFELVNLASVAGETEWSVLASRNGVVTADDRVIDSGRAMLQGQQRLSVMRTVTLPADLTPGRYTLGVTADPANGVSEASEVNNTASSASELVVAAGALAIADEMLPPIYRGIDYLAFLTAVGGDGTYAWRVTSGTLPRGVTLVPTTGELRGVPTELGAREVTIQVGSRGLTATRTYRLEVVEAIGGFGIVTRQLLPGVVGADYPPAPAMGEEPQRLRTLGGTGTTAFALESPAPPGLSLSPEGVFSGVPEQAGRFSIDIRATDGSGAEARRTLFLTIGEPGRIGIVADVLPDARVGVAYQARLRAVGASTATTAMFAAQGSPPTGVVIASNGVVAGIPRRVGNFSFTVTVTDGASGQTDTALFRIRVVADDSLRFRVEGSRTATVGRELDVELVAVGGTPPYTWRGAEDLPDGLDVSVEGPDGNVYRIRGTSSAPVFATFLATVGDADQRQHREAVSIRFVSPPPPPPADDSGGCRSARLGDGVPLAAGWLLALAAAHVLRRRRR